MKIDTEEAYSYVRSLVIMILILVLITISVIILVARYISKGISTPIVQMSKWVKDVANGSLDYHDITVVDDEIGDMKKSFHEVVNSLNSISEICEEITIGNFNKEFEIRSAEALINMVNMLKSATEKMEKQNWIENGQSGLNKIIQEEVENIDLGKSEKEYTKIINNAGKDLLGLINDILDLSKIESGKMDVNIEDCDIRVAIDDIYNMFLPLVKEMGINLIKNINSKVPKIIQTDEMKVSQVIKNLLSNAVKFTAEGEIEINMHLASNNRLAIDVRDTGIGIAEDK